VSICIGGGIGQAEVENDPELYAINNFVVELLIKAGKQDNH
jgi:hypothetical protein